MFKCEHCDIKPFGQKSHLTVHIKTKHTESGKRQCVSCVSTFAQINNFVVHYKKKHVNKRCEVCDTKKLCKICQIDLEEAKIKWQLSFSEVQSPNFEAVDGFGHTCKECFITFSQSSHLSTHIKLKHGALKRRLCTQCSSAFSQINNFVVHYKKKHLSCDCKDSKVCNECIRKVTQAKKLWLGGENMDTNTPQTSIDDSQSERFAGNAESSEIISASNDIVPISTIESSLPTCDANTSLAEAARSLELILSDEPSSQLMNAPLPAKRMKPSKGIVTPFKLDHSTLEASEMLVTTPTVVSVSATTTPCLIDRLVTSEIPIQKTAIEQCEKHNLTNQKHEQILAISDCPPNAKASAIVTSAANVCSPDDSECCEVIKSSGPALEVGKRILTVSDDELLAKLISTKKSSEIAHIKKKSKDKHLNQANVELVLREASKSTLDIDHLRTLQDIEKYWILATYFRRNPHIEYASVCKQAGADPKRLERFISHNISCEQAMGMFPGAYLRLKDDFKSNGANTEV